MMSDVTPSTGAMAQVAFSMVIQLLALWVTGFVQPYADARDGVIQQLFHFALTFMFVLFVLLAYDGSNTVNHFNKEALSGLLVAIVVLVLLFAIGAVVQMYDLEIKRGIVSVTRRFSMLRGMSRDLSLPLLTGDPEFDFQRVEGDHGQSKTELVVRPAKRCQ